MKHNLKYFALLVGIHTAVFVLWIFFADWLMAFFPPRITEERIGWASLALQYFAAFGTAYLFFRAWRKKCSPYVLPLSFLSLPIIFIHAGTLLAMLFGSLIPLSRGKMGAYWLFADIIFFCLPMALLTLISSIIVKKRRASS